MQYAAMGNAKARHMQLTASSDHYDNRIINGNVDINTAMSISSRHQMQQQVNFDYVCGSTSGISRSMQNNATRGPMTSSSSQETYVSKAMHHVETVRRRQEQPNVQPVGCDKVMTSPIADPAPLTTVNLSTRKRCQPSLPTVAPSSTSAPVVPTSSVRVTSVWVPSVEYTQSVNESASHVINPSFRPSANDLRVPSSDQQNKFQRIRQVVSATSSATSSLDDAISESCFTYRQTSSESSPLSMASSTVGQLTPSRPADGCTTVAAYLNNILEREINQEIMLMHDRRTTHAEVRETGGHWSSPEYESRRQSNGVDHGGNRSSWQTSDKPVYKNEVARHIRDPLDIVSDRSNATNWTKNGVVRAANVPDNRYGTVQTAVCRGYVYTGQTTLRDVHNAAPASVLRNSTSSGVTAAREDEQQQQQQLQVVQDLPPFRRCSDNGTTTRNRVANPVVYHHQPPATVPQHIFRNHDGLHQDQACRWRGKDATDHTQLPQEPSSACLLYRDSNRPQSSEVYQSASEAAAARIVVPSHDPAWRDASYQHHQQPSMPHHQQYHHQQQQQLQHTITTTASHQTPIDLSQPRSSTEHCQSQERPISWPSYANHIQFETIRPAYADQVSPPMLLQIRPQAPRFTEPYSPTWNVVAVSAPQQPHPPPSMLSRPSTLLPSPPTAPPAAQPAQPPALTAPAPAPAPAPAATSAPKAPKAPTAPAPAAPPTPPAPHPRKTAKSKAPATKRRADKKGATSKTSKAPPARPVLLPVSGTQARDSSDSPVSIVDSGMTPSATERREVKTVDNNDIAQNSRQIQTLSTYDLMIIDSTYVRMFMNCLDEQEILNTGKSGMVPLDLSPSMAAQRSLRDRQLPRAPTPVCEEAPSKYSFPAGHCSAGDVLLDLSCRRGWTGSCSAGNFETARSYSSTERLLRSAKRLEIRQSLLGVA